MFNENSSILLLVVFKRNDSEGRTARWASLAACLSELLVVQLGHSLCSGHSVCFLLSGLDLLAWENNSFLRASVLCTVDLLLYFSIYFENYICEILYLLSRVPCCWNIDLGCQRCKSKELGRPK